MPIYKQTTELTKIADFLTATEHDITEVYFGDKQVFTVWDTYDGTLPSQYSANGSMLADYRIYGAAGGVGDRTVNNFNAEIEQGNLYAGEIQPPTSGNYYKRCRTKGYVPVTAGNTITIKSQYDLWVYCYSGTTYISQYGSTNWSKKYTFTIPAGINNTKIMFANDDKTSYLYISDFVNDVMLVNGSTAPEEYVPYGYGVNMSVSDGTTSITTHVYIGDTPLEEDEYVSFKGQKVYRMSEGVLTPTDPPVSLPVLPTVDGTNIVDYAGQSAAIPSRFVAKYRKEDF